MAIARNPGTWFLVFGMWQALRPSADRTVKTKKNRLKLGSIRPLKNTKKAFDRSVDRSVELRLGLCYQQNVYPRVGSG